MRTKLRKLTTASVFCLAAWGAAPAGAMTLDECLAAVAAGGEVGAVCYNVFQIDAAAVAGPVLPADPVLQTGPANDPNDPAWLGATETVVNLPWQVRMDANTPPPAIENSFQNLANPDLTSRVFHVKVVHDATHIAFKIVFADPTANVSIADVPLFHDGLAVGIPYDERTDPIYYRCHTDILTDPQPDLIHMGNACPGDALHPCCPANLLFWRADKAEIENIVANGPGAAAETFETDVGIFYTYQSWSAGAWTVILTRPLFDPYLPVSNLYPGLNLITLEPAQTYDIVFGNWDGSIQERNGYKYIGPWGKLNLL